MRSPAVKLFALTLSALAGAAGAGAPNAAGGASDPIEIRFEDHAIVVEAGAGEGARTVDAGAVVSGRTLTITAAGDYRLSGRLQGGTIVVDTAESGAVRLLFGGVAVYAATGPALAVVQAEQVEIELAPGSFNDLFGGQRPDDEPGAALYSRAPLHIGGEGHLLVMARQGHGVATDGRLVVGGGVITVNAALGGVRGASVAVSGGDLTIFAATDALKATGGEGGGSVEIAGGSLDLVAGGDGVQAESSLRVSAGAVSVAAGGGHEAAVAEDVSAKGLKAEAELVIEGGAIAVDAADDALHSGGVVRVTGGALTLATGDDAVHADGAIEVTGGDITISASREGLEAPRLTITGGTALVHASDDALNAAGDIEQRDLLLTIGGGHVVLNAGSDAIDSNGSVHITGGTLVLNGPVNFFKPAIDQDHDLRLDGGVIVAVGSLVMRRQAGVHPASAQRVLYVDFHGPVGAGEIISVRSQEGYLVTFRAPQTLWTVSVSSPQLEAGARYEVQLGGTPTGAEQAGGLFAPAGVAGGAPRMTVRAQ